MIHKRYVRPYKLFVGAFIPNWLAEREEVSHGAKLVYARLCQYNGKDGTAYPSQARIADDIGVKERHARTLVGELIEHKLIEVESRGEGRRNVYLFPEHDWMEFDRANTPCQTEGGDGADRANTPCQETLFIIEQRESSNTRDAAAPPASPGKAKKPPKEVTPERARYLFDKGEWYAYAKAAYAHQYPGYLITQKAEKGLSLIFDRVVGGDLVKAKAFLQCALADGRNFLCGQRHDPMYLYSHANEWLTASRQWSGYKPELPDVKASRDAAVDAKRAEADRQRAEALEGEARATRELGRLTDGDREGLRVEFLATVVDERFRAKLASANWRESPVLAGGMHAVLRRRQLERVAGII